MVAPASTSFGTQAAISAGDRGKIVLPSRSTGIPALGCTLIGKEVASPNSLTNGKSCSGPREQFMPMTEMPIGSNIAAAVRGSVPVTVLP